MLALALCACGGDSPTEPTQASIAGTWELSTVNGSPLPYTVASFGADKVEIISEAVTFTANGTFSALSNTRTTESGQVTTESDTDTGTYTLNGTAITLTFASDATTATGTISGNTITAAESGFSFVFKKK
jgi:hypothetical protein